MITGHSATFPDRRFEGVSAFIGDLVKAVQDAKRAGRTLDEVVDTWKVPERYKGYTQPQPASLRANVQVIWDETR